MENVSTPPSSTERGILLIQFLHLSIALNKIFVYDFLYLLRAFHLHTAEGLSYLYSTVFDCIVKEGVVNIISFQ